LNVTIAELKQWNNLTGNDIELGQQLVYYQTEDADMETDSLPTEPSDPLINRNNQSQTEFYIVKSGDTLYDIARNHDMSVSQLQQLNNLTGSNLSIGQRLAVKKQTSTVAPNVARFQKESSPQGVFSVYEIPSGETKEMLLSKFKMTESELIRLNPELDIERLISGQEITVLLPPSRNYENPYLQKASLQDLGQVNVTRYSDQKVGATTTNGELYDPEMLTAAHSNIALGSIIFVENPVTGNGVYVKINDRITESGIKLSKKAYEVLNLKETGEPAVSIYTESND
jgi:LysM repeat protein